MKRSKFSLSNYKLLSARMGYIVPCGLVEVLPGDTVQHATSLLLRTQPLLAPVMHPVHVKIHHWYVPHRLVWEDFEDFITGGPDGLDASVYPTITIGGGSGAAIGSLADYLGVPTGVNNIEVSALPFRGYGLIFNEWYRDQDLVTALTVDIGSGPDTTTNTALKFGAWEKDYFTSARPWEQKGASISIPIGDTAPVELVPHTSSTNPSYLRDKTTGAVRAGVTVETRTSTGELVVNAAGTRHDMVYDPNGRLQADLSSASAITINALREAMALQRYNEARSRYGSRYTEYLAYLGVKSSDARLQRPEYLGGGKQTIQFSEVLQTAEGTNPVGEMRGHGISAMRSNRYRKFFEEHGYVFSFVTVRPKTIYAQGLARHWNRRYKEDFWQKELQHIGQQEILNKELYAAHATPGGTFGWQDRYDEYRRQESTIAGEFKGSTLDHWHMARIFGSTPALNSAFVTADPTTRIFPAESVDTMYIMARHQIQARRMISKEGTSFIY